MCWSGSGRKNLTTVTSKVVDAVVAELGRAGQGKDRIGQDWIGQGVGRKKEGAAWLVVEGGRSTGLDRTG